MHTVQTKTVGGTRPFISKYDHKFPPSILNPPFFSQVDEMLEEDNPGQLVIQEVSHS